MNSDHQPPRGRTVSFALFLCMLLLFQGGALAANVCDTQATQINPLSYPSAMGNTGRLVARPGLGGTGIDTGGIGGTGIVGVITGFASICVNGIEVHFDENTPISSNGAPGLASQLAVGQLVAVNANGYGDEMLARQISVIYAAIGPLDEVNLATGEFHLLGQTARASAPGALAGLEAGQWVRVSGHRTAQGEIAATFIETVTAQAEVQLNGFVSQLSGEQFEVGGARIQVNHSQLSNALTNGGEVQVTGRWNGRTLNARQILQEPVRNSLGQVDYVVLEGFAHHVDGQSLTLGSINVRLVRDVMVPPEVSQISTNRPMRVRAEMGNDQRLHASQIELGRGATTSSENNRTGGDSAKTVPNAENSVDEFTEPKSSPPRSGAPGGEGNSNSTDSAPAPSVSTTKSTEQSGRSSNSRSQHRSR